MIKEKVQNKGYTVEVVSWENDGDYYNTDSVTLEDKNEAIEIAKMCRDLFASANDRSKPGGIGNYNTDLDKVEDYFNDNPKLLDKVDETLDKKTRLQIDIGIAQDLVGMTDHGDNRVCESAFITFSPEDIYIESTILEY